MPRSDEPTPGQLLIDAVRAKVPTRTERRSIGLNITPQMNDLVLAAAMKRDMTLSAYARRAIMAVVCHDLGLDWDEVMLDEPNVRRFDGKTPGDPAGTGHGDWIIAEMTT